MEDRPLTQDERLQLDALLDSWLERTRVALSAYNDATTRTVAAERTLGVPAVALSAIVATGVFSTLEQDPAIELRIATGVLALAAAVLTALQTFLRHEERAEQFREAARSYGRLRRRIESAKIFLPQTRDEANEIVTTLADALADASRGKPNVPQTVWDRAELKVKGRSDARGLRALRLWIREHTGFGMNRRGARGLPEAHASYFSDLEHATVVPLYRLRATKPRQSQRRSVAVARRRMREAAAGKRERREPLSVSEGPDGSLMVLDGNATLRVAEEAGWTTIPVRTIAPQET